MQLLRLFSYVWRHHLNAADRVRAMGRVLRWQIASRLLPGPIGFPFVENTRLFASRGMTGATGNWYCGVHEVEEMGFMLHFLRADDLFLDVGANIGSYTVLVAGGVRARVISVEPIPATFANLQSNVLLNGLGDRTELHCMGLSSESSELLFTADLDTANHVAVESEQGRAIRVPVASMDEMLAGRLPKVIKIDIEGHKLSVLKGAHSTLANPGVEAVVMEINGSGDRYGVSDDELLGLMRDYGFEALGYDPFARRLVDRDPSSGNAVFVRDRGKVDSCVAAARRYCLVNGTI